MAGSVQPKGNLHHTLQHIFHLSQTLKYSQPNRQWSTTQEHLYGKRWKMTHHPDCCATVHDVSIHLETHRCEQNTSQPDTIRFSHFQDLNYKPPVTMTWNTQYMWRHSPSGTKLSFVRVTKMLKIIWAMTARPMLTACITTWRPFFPGWRAIWNLCIVADCSSEDWRKTLFVTTSSYFGLWMHVLETIFMVSLWLDL